MNGKLIYTKGIKNGKLKATDIQVGESVTGTLVGFRENKYGTYNVLLDVNGREVEIYAAGNLKFLHKDVEAGKKVTGVFTVITRGENKEVNGYPCTQFKIIQNEEEAAPAAQATATAPKASVKDQLDQIRAKRGTNS